MFVPNVVEGVPSEVLDPRSTWADKDAYYTQAKKLASLFRDNFAKFADGTSEDIKNAGPKG